MVLVDRFLDAFSDCMMGSSFVVVSKLEFYFRIHIE